MCNEYGKIKMKEKTDFFSFESLELCAVNKIEHICINNNENIVWHKIIISIYSNIVMENKKATKNQDYATVQREMEQIEKIVSE